ncbi:MAG TPA: hypothetical protein VGL74_05610 [Terriglobales bacterium]
MGNSSAIKDRYISLLSKIVIQGYGGDFSAPDQDLDHLQPALDHVSALNETQFADFLELADTHHVTVRALAVVERMAAKRELTELQAWCNSTLAAERARIAKAVEWLYAIVQALDMSGCPVSVIKSLDHWPDLGSDLDLYTSGSPEQVVKVMKEKMQAELEPRSWGDRLAGKWNFQIPGLKELVEIHVRYLGQTGEQKAMARRVLERGVTKTLNGRTFPVPAPEERLLISTLQRMYRHFYFRLCDMVDMANLLSSGAVNFVELRTGAERGGIWPGVASYLVILAEYVAPYGCKVNLPREVIEAAYSPDLKVQFRDNFLRVPMGPAAGLYGSQLLNASRHGDLRAISRLPLLPPLAVSALLAYRLTGSDKGVW